MVEIAIGGNTIGSTVDGRERYPISVRYARDFRDNIDSLKRVLVATPTGDQVPISLLADLRYRMGRLTFAMRTGSWSVTFSLTFLAVISTATSAPLRSESASGSSFLRGTTFNGQASSSICKRPRNGSPSSSLSPC